MGAVAYAYTFFTGTVVYALAAATAHWSALQAELDPWMTVHGIPLIAAGIAFGVAVVRARVLPASCWSRPRGDQSEGRRRRQGPPGVLHGGRGSGAREPARHPLQGRRQPGLRNLQGRGRNADHRKGDAKNAADAATKIKALPAYTAALTAFRAAETKAAADTAAHKPAGDFAKAEHAVVDPMIKTITDRRTALKCP